MMSPGGWVLVVGLLAVAQPPKVEPPPSPSVPAATAGWGVVRPEAAPLAGALPPPGPLPLEDRNDGILKGDPLLEGPPPTTPGWFAVLELMPLWTHVQNQLSQTVTAGGQNDVVSLPSAALDVTVSPRLTMGYTFPQGSGALLLSYRFVTTSGTESLTGFGPLGDTAELHSRFDLHVLDLDYASRELSLGPRWDFRWLAGVRLANLFFDSQATDGLVTQHESNYVPGVGPLAGLELGWHLQEQWGLSLFSRLETSFLAGRIRQRFEESVPGGVGESAPNQVQGMPTLGMEVGLSWRPPALAAFQLTAGYTWERWWNVGAVGTIPGSAAEVTLQGLFLRAAWNY
jgi:hypothetical protein